METLQLLIILWCGIVYCKLWAEVQRHIVCKTYDDSCGWDVDFCLPPLGKVAVNEAKQREQTDEVPGGIVTGRL